MIPQFITEVNFRFSRSGGAGGQNVNKVESAATGIWVPALSVHYSPEQKEQLQKQLVGRINKNGELVVKSQIHRGQLANRDEVLEKMAAIVHQALQKKKARLATKPSKAAQKKRIEGKKQRSEVKSNRNKIKYDGD